MSNDKMGGPAFPRAASETNNPSGFYEPQTGMTLWDYYAARAMRPIPAFPRSLWQAVRWVFGFGYKAVTINPTDFAFMAGKYADAMLAERAKRIGGDE